MFCVNCGLQLPDDAKFCSVCGNKTKTCNIYHKQQFQTITGYISPLNQPFKSFIVKSGSPKWLKPTAICIGIMVVIVFVYYVSDKRNSASNASIKENIINTAESFLNAVSTSDKNKILIYSTATSNDFNELFDTVEDFSRSFLGDDITYLLSGIVMPVIFEYKIQNINLNGNIAAVTINFINLNNNLDIKVVRSNNKWLVDYENFNRDFNKLILKSSVQLLFQLGALGIL